MPPRWSTSEPLTSQASLSPSLVARRYSRLACPTLYSGTLRFTRAVSTYIYIWLLKNMTLQDTQQTNKSALEPLNEYFHKNLHRVFLCFVCRHLWRTHWAGQNHSNKSSPRKLVSVFIAIYLAGGRTGPKLQTAPLNHFKKGLFSLRLESLALVFRFLHLAKLWITTQNSAAAPGAPEGTLLNQVVGFY